MKSFLQFCEENGIMVFYISNRSVRYLDPTVNNLLKYNLPNADPGHIFLQETTSNKTDRRAQVMNEAQVLLYIGDNLRDFDEMFADRSKNYGKDVVKDEVSKMLPQYILLPNPMYGQWRSIFSFPEGASEAEKAKAKVQQAQPMDY